MRNIWNVLCSRTIIDSSTNNISLINVLEQVNAPLGDAPGGGGIALPIEWNMTSLWSRDDLTVGERASARISIEGPNGERIGGGEFDVDLTIHLRARTTNQQSVLVVTGAGIHWFIVELQIPDGTWTEVGRVPLLVRGSEVPWGARAN